jgi:hypothetical protein
MLPSHHPRRFAVSIHCLPADPAPGKKRVPCSAWQVLLMSLRNRVRRVASLRIIHRNPNGLGTGWSSVSEVSSGVRPNTHMEGRESIVRFFSNGRQPRKNGESHMTELLRRATGGRRMSWKRGLRTTFVIIVRHTNDIRACVHAVRLGIITLSSARGSWRIYAGSSQ